MTPSDLDRAAAGNGPRPDPIADPDAIVGLAGAFQGSRVLLAAIELDLFTALGEAARTSAEAAAGIGADPRATDRLLRALAALGLIGLSGERFRNRPAAARHLVRGEPGFLGQLDHSAALYRRWATLDDAVRAGGSVLDRPAGDPAWTETFIAAMHNRAGPTADSVAAGLGLGGARRMLDLGGGSGVYAIACCRAAPDLRATVLDRPEVTPLTARYVAEAGLAGRIETLTGDYFTTPFGSGWDLVLMSAILHSHPPDDCARLVARAVDALAPGGRAAVLEFVMDASRTRPAAGALFALNMLVNTAAGDAYTEAEIGGWLTAAGCREVARVETAGPTALMVGRKPRN